MATDNGEVNMAAEDVAGEVKPVEKTPVTVGRMVLFRMSEDVTFPAVVTKVPSQEAIDLQIFGTQHDPFVYGASQGEGVGQWDWMPFQKDQQARLAKETQNDSHPAA